MGDFALTTFSKKGDLPQISNALAAVAKGETCIGIKAKNGVVLAVQKKVPSIIVDETSFSKIQNLCGHVGATYSGLGPDFKLLAQFSRKAIMKNTITYNQPMQLNSICREIAEAVQEYTISGGYRPFGVSMLVAGYDEDGPHLYQIDPSGAYYAWKATALGQNMKNAQTFLEKRYNPEMEIDDAVHTALLTLQEGFQGEMTSTNIEVGVVGKDGIFKLQTPSEIQDYFQELE